MIIKTTSVQYGVSFHQLMSGWTWRYTKTVL